MMEEWVVDLTQLFVYVNFAKTNRDQVRGLIVDMRRNLDGIVQSNFMRGAIKLQIDNLILNQQIPLLLGLENVYWKMFVETNRAVNEFMSAMSENDESAVFNHSSLVDLEGDMARVNDDVSSLNAEFQGVYRSIEDDISLSMPSNDAYERNYERARTSLRNTRECLEEFNFDYEEIRAAMEEIGRYVEKIEDAGNLCITSQDRANLFGDSDFGQRMRDMHLEFAIAERERIDRMVASWEGMDYDDIIRSLPNPMTIAEWEALMDYVGETNNDFWNALIGGVVGEIDPGLGHALSFVTFARDAFVNEDDRSFGHIVAFYGGDPLLGLATAGILGVAGAPKIIIFGSGVIIAAGYNYAYDNWGWFQSFVHLVGDGIDSGVTFLVDTNPFGIGDVIVDIGEAIDIIQEAVEDSVILEAAGEIVGEVFTWENISDWWTDGGQEEFFGGIADAAQWAWGGFVSGVQSVGSWIGSWFD